jgi:hypothetical protein
MRGSGSNYNEGDPVKIEVLNGGDSAVVRVKDDDGTELNGIVLEPGNKVTLAAEGAVASGDVEAIDGGSPEDEEAAEGGDGAVA